MCHIREVVRPLTSEGEGGGGGGEEERAREADELPLPDAEICSAFGHVHVEVRDVAAHVRGVDRAPQLLLGRFVERIPVRNTIYRWHLEKNATQMPAISWRLTG